jgi:competence protein ComEC
VKLPALAIAAAFSLGIVVGLLPAFSNRANSPVLLGLLFGLGCTSLLTGIVLVHFRRLAIAGAASLLCWIALGLAGVCVDQQPRSANHILELADDGKINLKSPLRYSGQLRDEPEQLPFGKSYDIELSGVDAGGAFLAAKGGLRLSWMTQPDRTAPPTLHAGDMIAVLAQAKLPQVYRDEGAFDRRAYLSQHGVDLVAALRAGELLELVKPGRPSVGGWISRVRRNLREEIDMLWATSPRVAGVMRAMLLGDRTFIEREEARDFQKTGAFHVLVVAGLHVGAIAMVLFWAGRKLKWSRVWTMSLTLLLLLGYVSVVEQRAPVLRAGLMAAIVVIGGCFFRRLDLLNSAAVAMLLILMARPLEIRDASFQLSFLAIGCIAGLALPWLEETIQPYARALHGWRDVTRDAGHEPRAAQFRIDIRSVAQAMEAALPSWLARMTTTGAASAMSFTFRVSELFVLTLALQIGMLPLFASEFHRITLAAPFANFAAVPLTAVIVPLGFLTLIAGYVFLPVGKALGVLLGMVTQFLLHVVQWCAGFERLSYRIPSPPIWVATAFLVLVAMLAAYFRVPLRFNSLVKRSLYSALAILAVLMATSPFSARIATGKLEVTILDVGQGDSLFVVSPAGKTLLIDGGGAFGGFPGHEQQKGIDPGEEAVSPYLWARGFKKIDVVALTHAHQDHLGGLTAILENFRVGKLWIGREVKNPAMAKLEALARERNVLVERESRSKTFSLDGAEGEFLWPEDSDADAAPAAKNNDSLVLRLKFGNETLLLPGDAEKQAERTMLAEYHGDELRADVLKVGHHGSKNSTTQEFLEAVHPKIAVISAGEDNPYGHPSRELLERLENAGVLVLRTDRDGAVHIVTDGEKLDISCFVACPDTAPVTASRRAETPDQQQDHQQ